MLAQFGRWCWEHKKSTAGGLLLFMVVSVNAVAYMHARAMTHFSRDGERTSNPEELSLWEKVKVLLVGVNVPRPTSRIAPDHFGLSYEIVLVQGPDGADLEAWHIPHHNPQGLVLMFHGYSAAKSSLLREATALHELGYATMLVDFRGSGGSTGGSTSIGVYEADDVAISWNYARSRWPGLKLALFGQSMGAAAVLRAVAVHEVQPDVLILECPFDRMLSTVENRFHSMNLPAFPLAHMLVFWGGVQHGFNGFTHNPVNYAYGVACPVLLLHGADDPRVTLPQVEAIFDNLRGPKRFHLFHGVGHGCYVASCRDEWKEAIGSFLSSERP